MNIKYWRQYRILGLNIAYYRKLAGFSQEDLAEIVDIAQPHLSNIEVAKVGISMDLLFAISEALGVEPSRLLEIRE